LTKLKTLQNTIWNR